MARATHLRETEPASHLWLRIVVEALVALLGLWLVVWGFRVDRSWFETHTLWRYCAIDPAELRRASVERWMVGCTGTVLALVVRPKLGRWAARPIRRESVVSTARIAVAALLALVASDLVLRLKMHGDGPRIFLPFSKADARYEWDNTASHTVATYGERSVRYDIDAAGNRVQPDEVVDTTRPTILFAGESITFGHGLEYAQTYVPMVGNLLHVQTANLAVSAYGNDQVFLRTHDQLQRFVHPVAVVTLILATQIVRNIEENRGHTFPADDGSMVHVPEVPLFLRNSPLRRLWKMAVGVRSTSAIAIAGASLRATAREARARGAVPLFVFTNWGPPCLPDDRGTPPIERILFEGIDGPHIHVDLDPALWDKTIDHPDPRAHRVLASAIADALRPLMSAEVSDAER
jgi:hypothetical protein